MNKKASINWDKWNGMIGDTDVFLVYMPFAKLHYPSISLGVLNAALRNAHINSSVLYANLIYAEQIGMDQYSFIDIATGSSMHWLPDWMFADRSVDSGAEAEYYRKALHHEIKGQSARFGYCLDDGAIGAILANMMQTRESILDFVDDLAHFILAKHPRVLACTSALIPLTAIISLFNRVRELDPEVVTVAGGPDFWGKTGGHILRSFPSIDIIFSGEADAAIVPLTTLLIDQGRDYAPGDLPHGAVDRVVAHQFLEEYPEKEFPKACLPDLDAGPTPDFGEYFKSLDLFAYKESVYPGLIIETSRGCWWAKRKGCTFCNMNSFMNRYRSKSAFHVLNEFNELAARYHHFNFALADSAVDRKYFKDLIPELAASTNPFTLFCEIRPNLSPDNIRQLADAGIRYVQVGIEGLHDKMLQIMNKGIKSIRNVQVLKFTQQFGITVMWNYLTGFPEERDEWHAEVCTWLPLIYHFHPPVGIAPSTLVYVKGNHYYQNREQYGLHLEPDNFYHQIYPFKKAQLETFAYYFQDKHHRRRFHQEPASSGIEALGNKLRLWHEAFKDKKRPALFVMHDNGDHLAFYDTRPCACSEEFNVTGLKAEICRKTNTVKSHAGLERALLWENKKPFKTAEIVSAINELKERKVLLQMGREYLCLAFSVIPRKTKLSRHEYPGGLNLTPDFIKMATGHTLAEMSMGVFS